MSDFFIPEDLKSVPFLRPFLHSVEVYARYMNEEIRVFYKPLNIVTTFLEKKEAAIQKYNNELQALQKNIDIAKLPQKVLRDLHHFIKAFTKKLSHQIALLQHIEEEKTLLMQGFQNSAQKGNRGAFYGRKAHLTSHNRHIHLDQPV